LGAHSTPLDKIGGCLMRVDADGRRSERLAVLVLCGAFNPPHRGHMQVRMRRTAACIADHRALW
jgi:hypothetical protein